jgi:two-component system OmpR family sensor kinase
LEAFTGTRSSGFVLDAPPGELTVGLAQTDTEHLVWRLLATLAGAARPGEILPLALSAEGHCARLTAHLPEALAAMADPFEAMPPQAGHAINAGVFGSGFTLRLAAAEVRAAGGSLLRVGDALHMMLPDAPGLTVSDCLHYPATSTGASAA